MTIRFWISSFISEIFVAELRIRPKSGQILHVFRPRNFFGVRPPKILDRHYKTRPTTDHRAKFHVGRPTHLGDLASEEKNIMHKTEVLLIKNRDRQNNKNRPKCLYNLLSANNFTILLLMSDLSSFSIGESAITLLSIFYRNSAASPFRFVKLCRYTTLWNINVKHCTDGDVNMQ